MITKSSKYFDSLLFNLSNNFLLFIYFVVVFFFFFYFFFISFFIGIKYFLSNNSIVLVFSLRRKMKCRWRHRHGSSLCSFDLKWFTWSFPCGVLWQQHSNCTPMSRTIYNSKQPWAFKYESRSFKNRRVLSFYLKMFRLQLFLVGHESNFLFMIVYVVCNFIQLKS